MNLRLVLIDKDTLTAGDIVLVAGEVLDYGEVPNRSYETKPARLEVQQPEGGWVPVPFERT